MKKKPIKPTRFILFALCLALPALQTVKGTALLLDMFGGSDPTSSADWANAGVTEDLTGAAGGTLTASGGVFNISGGLTHTNTGVTNIFGASTFPGNPMLNNYWYVADGGTMTIAIGGFADGSGTPNPLTGGLGSMTGGFTIGANQTYKMYLFGAGDQNGQNTTFNFGGVDKTTNASIAGTAASDNHFVTYEFTTPADLTGFQISFTAKHPTGASTGAINGMALVPVPEPSGAALLLVGLSAMLARHRRGN